jgi:hypothetical protein
VSRHDNSSTGRDSLTYHLLPRWLGKSLRRNVHRVRLINIVGSRYMCRPNTPGHCIRASRSLYDTVRGGFSGPARFCCCPPVNNNVKERTRTVSLSITSPRRALSLFAKSLGRFQSDLVDSKCRLLHEPHRCTEHVYQLMDHSSQPCSHRTHCVLCPIILLQAPLGGFICAKPHPTTDSIKVISSNVYIVGVVFVLFVFALVAAIVSVRFVLKSRYRG